MSCTKILDRILNLLKEYNVTLNILQLFEIICKETLTKFQITDETEVSLVKTGLVVGTLVKHLPETIVSVTLLEKLVDLILSKRIETRSLIRVVIALTTHVQMLGALHSTHAIEPLHNITCRISDENGIGDAMSSDVPQPMLVDIKPPKNDKRTSLEELIKLRKEKLLK